MAVQSLSERYYKLRTEAETRVSALRMRGYQPKGKHSYASLLPKVPKTITERSISALQKRTISYLQERMLAPEETKIFKRSIAKQGQPIQKKPAPRKPKQKIPKQLAQAEAAPLPFEETEPDLDRQYHEKYAYELYGELATWDEYAQPNEVYDEVAEEYYRTGNIPDKYYELTSTGRERVDKRVNNLRLIKEEADERTREIREREEFQRSESEAVYNRIADYIFEHDGELPEEYDKLSEQGTERVDQLVQQIVERYSLPEGEAVRYKDKSTGQVIEGTLHYEPVTPKPAQPAQEPTEIPTTPVMSSVVYRNVMNTLDKYSRIRCAAQDYAREVLDTMMAMPEQDAIQAAYELSEQGLVTQDDSRMYEELADPSHIADIFLVLSNYSEDAKITYDTLSEEFAENYEDEYDI